LPVPDLQMVHKKTHPNAFTSQPTVHGVDIVIAPDRTAGSNASSAFFYMLLFYALATGAAGLALQENVCVCRHLAV
jgi:hypothetical protein